MAESVPGCVICDLEQVDEVAIVFRDELWACEVLQGFDVPGWYVLRARRHAETLTELADIELVSFGVRARNMVAAVAEVTGAPATYILVFGENHRHFHALIAARAEHVPENRRTGDILKLRTEFADSVAALALVPAVRDAYQRHAGVLQPGSGGHQLDEHVGIDADSIR
jgi:diadenosine tetraphosphate (Ap4A) HIT family hydrolase